MRRLVVKLGIVCTVVLLLSVGCAGSSATKTSSDSESSSSEFSDSNLNSSGSSSTNNSRNRALLEEKEGSITQSEKRETEGKATGESGSSVRHTIEYIDPITGKITKKEIFEVEVESSTKAERNATDTRDQDGSFSGVKSAKDSASKQAQKNSNEEVVSSTASRANEEKKSELKSEASSGLSFWFWVILGLLGALAIAMFIFSRTLAGRITRLATFLATVNFSKVNSDQYASVLNFKDRDLVRKRKMD